MLSLLQNKQNEKPSELCIFVTTAFFFFSLITDVIKRKKHIFLLPTVVCAFVGWWNPGRWPPPVRMREEKFINGAGFWGVRGELCRTPTLPFPGTLQKSLQCSLAAGLHFFTKNVFKLQPLAGGESLVLCAAPQHHPSLRLGGG